MRVEHSIEIVAPVARVWELTVDVESWPKLTPTITSVERLDERLDPAPFRVGSTARIKQPAQRAKTWTVTVLDPQRRFAWATRTLGTTMTASHVLAATPTGTRNTLAVDIEGRLAPLVGALVRRPVLKAISTENHGFKSAAEA